MPPKVAVITGPTATGKTALGVALAAAMHGEIVGADSMQIYRHMDIGTAKPTPEEMHGIPHHMVDCVSPFDSYSVARYVQDASACVDEILARGKLPIVVGGTGLYIDSLLSGRDFAPEGATDGLRTALRQELDTRGALALWADLAACDPQTAAKLHPNDHKRIIRALEVYRATGMTKTQYDQATQTIPPRYDAAIIALTFKDRQDLYNRIDLRVDQMIQQGLEQEVRGLLDLGLGPQHTAMQAIGYKEMAAALAGNCTISQAVADIKQASRHYAKRQLSYLARNSSIHWIQWEKSPDFAFGILDSTNFLKACGVI